MREYEPIWIRLKQKKVAALVASPKLHRRIMKAVCKERNNDLAYKLELSESNRKAKLEFESDDKKLTIKLKEYSNVRYI